MVEVLDHYHGPPHRKLWLIAWAEKANDGSRTGYCKREILAARLGRSLSRVAHIAGELEAEGTIKRLGGGVWGKAAVYELPPLDSSQGATGQQPTQGATGQQPDGATGQQPTSGAPQQPTSATGQQPEVLPGSNPSLIIPDKPSSSSRRTTRTGGRGEPAATDDDDDSSTQSADLDGGVEGALGRRRAGPARPRLRPVPRVPRLGCRQGVRGAARPSPPRRALLPRLETSARRARALRRVRADRRAADRVRRAVATPAGRSRATRFRGRPPARSRTPSAPPPR